MSTDDEDRFAEALRERAARNRRELEAHGVTYSEPEPPFGPLTPRDVADLMCAEFDVTRNNQSRIEEQLRQMAEVQQGILTELKAIRKKLPGPADGPSPDALRKTFEP